MYKYEFVQILRTFGTRQPSSFRTLADQYVSQYCVFLLYSLHCLRSVYEVLIIIDKH